LFNPGGPGDSGVDFLNATGDAFALALGDEFDLVSFDPRGISRSTPKISFFDVGVGRGEREVWGNHSFDLIRGGAGDEFWDIQGLNGRSVEDAWARNIVANKLAGENAGEWLGNVNTEQTAYDMLSIINAYGQKKLMYWGVSYGTVLGSTFASLFPVSVYLDRFHCFGSTDYSGQG
jgi:pimeloyl-ACP methyl ester carboxylesterase